MNHDQGLNKNSQRVARFGTLITSVFLARIFENFEKLGCKIFFPSLANIISSSIFAFVSTLVAEFLLTTFARAFAFVVLVVAFDHLDVFADFLRAFGIFVDLVGILKISHQSISTATSNFERRCSKSNHNFAFTNLRIPTSHVQKAVYFEPGE